MSLNKFLRGTALISSLSISLTAIPAYAGDLDEIIVTGSRLNQTAAEIGTSVSIITSDDIKELGFDFAVDAVASAPGVTVNANGAFGGQASVRIRGAASEQTLVIIDGVPVNDPTSLGGGFNFAHVDTENLDRIEILKGPQSTLWGTDAIGGVVSITTKRPDEGFGGTAFLEYGSFDTLRGGASVENANEIGDFRLAIATTNSDGISKADENNGNTEDDAYDAITISAKGGVNFGDDAHLSANILWADAETEFDSFSFSGAVDGDALSETEELSANVSLTGSLFDGRLDNLLLIGYSDISRENSGADAFPFAADGDREIFRYQGTLNINNQNTLAFGAESEETRSGDDKTSIDGLFALYEFKPFEELTLTGGLRYDDHNQFGDTTTGRIAIAYNPIDQLTLRGSWGEGFKAPTIGQQTGGGFVPANPDLQPETSHAFDVGMDWRSLDGRIEAGVSVFDQDIEDQIVFTSTGYMNVSEVETSGIEIYGSYEANDWLKLSMNYAYIDAQDGSGNPLRRVPENSGDVTLSLDPEGPLSGAILLRYNGEEQDGANIVEDWTRIDVTGQYDITDNIELFGRIENLADKEYQQIFSYGTPDRSVYLGARVNY